MKPYKKLRHGSIDTNTTTIPLISFGAGMINTNANHIHGYPVGSTNLVRKHLLERQRRGLCLIGHANEYLTSQVIIISILVSYFALYIDLLFLWTEIGKCIYGKQDHIYFETVPYLSKNYQSRQECRF